MPEKTLTPEQLELARKVRGSFLLAQLPAVSKDGKTEKYNDFTREGLWAMKSDNGAEAAAECDVSRNDVVRILFPPPDKGEMDGRLNVADEELLRILHAPEMTEDRRAKWVETGRIPPAPVAPPAADNPAGEGAVLVVTREFRVSHNGAAVVDYKIGDKIPLADFNGDEALIQYARQHCR